MLGASMAGLMAACVLREFYDRVTVVERDELADSVSPRRGVPQSAQPHVMLARCGQVLEDLLPGISDELISSGAHQWCDGDLTRFYSRLGGHLTWRDGRIENPRSLAMLHASRPFIECHVRRRVRALPDVILLDGHDLDTLTWSGGTVTGARVTRRSDRRIVDIAADVVVDATGRGSRTPVFLDQMGFARPRENDLTVNVSYVSMPIRIPEGVLREYLFIDLFQPGRPRGFSLSRCENDDWIMLVGTLGKEVRPPASAAELVAQAEDLMPAHAFEALRHAERLGDVALHRFPASRWRRYDKMRRSPDGLLITGDAVCSFNPIYGQGMTLAAIDAVTLRDCLRDGAEDLPVRFHRKAAKNIRIAWRSAVGSDLALPEVRGPRSLSTRVMNAFIGRILQASETDPWVVREFLLVTGMLEPPTRLLRPEMLRRILTHAVQGRESQAPVAASATA